MDDHVAVSDCERLVQVWADVVWQPVNTVSSLAMGGFGLYLLLRSRAWVDPARRRALTLVGAALLAAGIGSVLYHGPAGFLPGWHTT